MKSGQKHGPPAAELEFDEAAGLLKALGHPLRLRLVCGLLREPSCLSRIASDLGAPISTIALHLGVLRRAGVLEEERRGSEIVFRVGETRARSILGALCSAETDAPPAKWAWGKLALGQTVSH